MIINQRPACVISGIVCLCYYYCCTTIPYVVLLSEFVYLYRFEVFGLFYIHRLVETRLLPNEIISCHYALIVICSRTSRTQGMCNRENRTRYTHEHVPFWIPFQIWLRYQVWIRCLLLLFHFDKWELNFILSFWSIPFFFFLCWRFFFSFYQVTLDLCLPTGPVVFISRVCDRRRHGTPATRPGHPFGNWIIFGYDSKENPFRYLLFGFSRIRAFLIVWLCKILECSFVFISIWCTCHQRDIDRQIFIRSGSLSLFLRCVFVTEENPPRNRKEKATGGPAKTRRMLSRERFLAFLLVPSSRLPHSHRIHIHFSLYSLYLYFYE